MDSQSGGTNPLDGFEHGFFGPFRSTHAVVSPAAVKAQMKGRGQSHGFDLLDDLIRDQQAV